MLSAVLAQEIARDTSAVIGHNVLITDASGVVIGSGDESRVGSFHEASVEVLRTQRPRTHSPAEAGRLHGVKPGITLPILIQGEAVGTVGITGAPDRVRRFGLVVKRQTEILLQESATLRTRLLRERALEDLLRDIATFDAELVDADLVRFRARDLGIDLGVPRVVVAVDLRLPVWAGGEPSPPRSELLDTARATFPDPQDVVTGTASGRLVVLHRLPAGGLGQVSSSCRKLVAAVAARHGLVARAAVGDPADSVAGLHDSYRDAAEALRIGARVAPREPVHTIDELRVHQALAAIGPPGRARFTRQVTGPLREQGDWPVLRETVVAWCENGFNLVRTAAALHVHRNTLVYRLAKVEQLVGRSPRDGSAVLALYLACLSDQLDSDQLDAGPAGAAPGAAAGARIDAVPVRPRR